MSKHILVVMTNAVDGRDAEFNQWYTDVHIREVVDIPGFVSAQRFKRASSQLGGAGDYEYLAIYEIEAPDAGTALQALKDARPNLQMSDALDKKVGAWAFSPISEKVTDSAA